MHVFHTINLILVQSVFSLWDFVLPTVPNIVIDVLIAAYYLLFTILYLKFSRTKNKKIALVLTVVLLNFIGMILFINDVGDLLSQVFQ